MDARGLLGHEQVLADLAVGAAARYEGEYLLFARRQAERILDLGRRCGDRCTHGREPRTNREPVDLGKQPVGADRERLLACVAECGGRLLALESADAIKQRYEAETLEEAFFAATGREFEAEGDEDDDDREVFA